MADDSISRRAVLPAVLAGAAVVAAAGDPAAAAVKRPQYLGACGPCIIMPGQSLTFSYFNPVPEESAGGPGSLARNRSRGTYVFQGRLLPRHLLATFEDTLGPGEGVKITFRRLVDGSLWLIREDQELHVAVGDLTGDGPAEICFVLVALLLPAVQAAREAARRVGPSACVQLSNNSRGVAGEGPGPVVTAYSLEDCLISS
ncbi:MAG: hypothetical protein ACK47B_09985 [Armatimonadota bacterium]